MRRPRLQIGYLIALLLIGYFDMWEDTMKTVSMTSVCGALAIIIGIPIGILMSHSDRLQSLVKPILDVMQTLPSFVYLIPVVMLFQVGTVSQIVAIVVYSAIPVVRYTLVGLRGVPQDIVEAAITSGCTVRQILWKVRMPLALPEIMLGLNQTIMFGLFMVMIAGFIGGNFDLAREIFKAKAQNDAGLGLLLALCVAFLGLATDLLFQTWANRRKVRLGLI